MLPLIPSCWGRPPKPPRASLQTSPAYHLEDALGPGIAPMLVSLPTVKLLLNLLFCGCMGTACDSHGSADPRFLICEMLLQGKHLPMCPLPTEPSSKWPECDEAESLII